jgi:formate hydrogenlyase subunit 3/multisubunit Na+/H+ antiporter MnhD subunit
MHPFLLVILVPVLAGLLGYIAGRLRNEFSFIGAVITLYYAVRLFFQSRGSVLMLEPMSTAGIPIAFRLDALAGFILLFTAVFAILVVVFSFRYMKGKDGLRGYYLYLLLGLACANGVVLAANLVVMLFFWGAMLAVVYGLLLVGRKGAEAVATKALVIVGLSDFLMLTGIALLIHGNWIDLAPSVPLALSQPSNIAAFLLITAGALAKAGSMPFHSWIPAAAETAPATVMAYIPASLDKLLGIYLLTRLATYMFDIAGNLAVRNTLMAVGSVTILGAVMMALVQKRVMKLLSFHAVSQVGYMVLGIGTGIPVGIAGGLFHMLNHAIYKAGLFLSAGSVEHWAKTDDIDQLGGVARQMPVTFVSFLVCAMAISGVPPLNGFASKWMVYQGVIGVGREGNGLAVVFLVCAMLGSVLTLASFLKLLHSMFFGQRPGSLARVREVGFAMWLPPAVLAALCVVFGVLAWQLPLRGFIYPSLPMLIEVPGIWQPVLVTLLMLVALAVGLTVYLFGTGAKPVPGRTFVGGERIADDEESRVTGTAFYSSVKHLPILDELLRFGGAGAFDLYNWVVGVARGLAAVFEELVDAALQLLYRALGRLTLAGARLLSSLATGVLPVYVAWAFVGGLVFFLVLMLR